MAASPATRRRFENKVVVITGATSGIGRAAALAFAAEGVRSASAAAANFSGARSNRRFAHTGLQRMATPQEIAAFALVLASQDHPYMTGAQMVAKPPTQVEPIAKGTASRASKSA